MQRKDGILCNVPGSCLLLPEKEGPNGQKFIELRLIEHKPIGWGELLGVPYNLVSSESKKCLLRKISKENTHSVRNIAERLLINSRWK
ncbi:hypothetical protein AMJ49_01250 [Parcubacteria bacterium DG_74_2]|nr:MAG: hypothetical protein AMJ49_01250 [Parcubacteria bacterium DG_74_2]